MAEITESRNTSTRRAQRTRIACVRCQRRKIRCDASFPICGSCNKAHTDCQYQSDLHGRPVSQAYISQLESKLRDLETIVRTRCPDVDLDDELNCLNRVRVYPSQDVIDGGRTDERTGRTEQHSDLSNDVQTPQQSLGHQIGLVSVSAGVNKYIGPSSGHLLAQLIFSASSNGDLRGEQRDDSHNHASRTLENEVAREMFWTTPAEPPATEELAQRLSDSYFTSLHLTYPFLLEPKHRETIRDVYSGVNKSPIALFHVNMVLSLSAIVATRRSKIQLPAERWCAAAIEQFSRMNVDTSIEGLQSLLLLQLYAIHSPASKVNAWQVNYACLGLVLDLGLQRDSPRMCNTEVERQLRRRIFWTVYSMDRTLSTMMGRPIGLRDEGCDHALPTDISDSDLCNATATSTSATVNHMSYANHLFELARINSEMKYVLHSVQRGVPAYAYPPIRDISAWQVEVSSRLDVWSAEIPSGGNQYSYVSLLCIARYHSLKMSLYCPTPAIPSSTAASLRKCYEGAVGTIRTYNQMYLRGMFIYSWTLLHTVINSATLLLYTGSTLPELSKEVSIEIWLEDFRAASNILSAIGEHWPGAKRSRDLLDCLTSKVLQRIIANSMGPPIPSIAQYAPESGISGQNTGADPFMNDFSMVWDGSNDFDLDSFARTFDWTAPMT